ncbi:hypothetical protein D3C72_2466640 [compost metagenome]
MRQQVDGIKSVARMQIVSHLLQALSPLIKHHSLYAGGQSFQQASEVIKPTIKKSNFTCICGRGGRG